MRRACREKKHPLRFLNFKNVVVQKKFSEELTIWNSGSTEGTFEFPPTLDNENFNLQAKPAGGSIKARSSVTLELQLQCKTNPHTLHELLDIHLGNQSSLVPKTKSLDVGR